MIPVDAAAKAARLKPDSYTVIRFREPFSFSRLISLFSSRNGAMPLNVSLEGTPAGRAFVPKRGMLYYLPANY